MLPYNKSVPIFFRSRYNRRKNFNELGYPYSIYNPTYVNPVYLQQLEAQQQQAEAQRRHWEQQKKSQIW